MVFGIARFWAYGWIDDLYDPSIYHFTFRYFGWVRPWPAPWMHVHLGAAALAAATMALGLWPRVSAAVFCALFTYAELIEKSAYLNHYYLVSILAFLFAWAPLCAQRATTRGTWMLFRGQVGLVYVFAGIAKLDTDWLVRAEPLRTWLQAYADLPLIGTWLAGPSAAYAMSWSGAAFDLLVVPALLWRRTRPYAYAVAVVFHVSIWCLFPVGLFSWLMLACATVFFAPDWPRRLTRVRLPSVVEPPLPPKRWAIALAAAWLVFQIAMPLRHLTETGEVNWHERGYRFAWRVMLIEKTGSVAYRICSDQRPRCTDLNPRSELTELQSRMLQTQPDMIVQYAQHLARRYRGLGETNVRVYADAWAALNGRPRQRLIDRNANLADPPAWPELLDSTLSISSQRD